MEVHSCNHLKRKRNKTQMFAINTLKIRFRYLKGVCQFFRRLYEIHIYQTSDLKLKGKCPELKLLEKKKKRKKSYLEKKNNNKKKNNIGQFPINAICHFYRLLHQINKF